MKRLESIEFRTTSTGVVPVKPWPQVFYVASYLMNKPLMEIRPLTLTGLLKGLGKNFITMNWRRLMRLLFKAGFLTTKEGAMMRWHDFTLRFWVTRQQRRERERQRTAQATHRPDGDQRP